MLDCAEGMFADLHVELFIALPLAEVVVRRVLLDIRDLLKGIAGEPYMMTGT